MRVPVYLVCAALVVAVKSEDRTNYYGGKFLEPVDVAADQETVSYLLPKLAAKYRPNSEWSGVTDPRFYVLTEMESNDIDNQVPSERTIQRRSPTISIAAPIDVLRKTWEQERARKQMLKNREFLNSLH
uniref:Corticotropin-releasing factor-like diuretic hormone n=1 Tax=Zophobas atratus TaxID=7074 RepID=A0A977SQ42_ZOPAT|nr:corticotropin-releasing factor-like diuretic hormone [Zophobas atratus]